jgi:hypothetical protein
MSPEHIRIAELAKEDKERKFSSIAHLLTVDALHEAFKDLRKDASAGVDRVTHTEYATEVQKNLEQLHDRLKGREVSGAAAAADLHSEGGRTAKADLDPLSGR